MPLSRRRFVNLSAGAALAPVTARFALAQSYPARAVRLLVGFPPGGPNDILGRLIARWLTDRLGQPFAVENMTGDAGNVATAAAVRAPPDGYTLLLVGPSNAINGSLNDKLSFDFLRDIAPIAGLTREPLVMLVNPGVPAASAPALIAYAKANPGKLKLALTDPGSAPHATGELFRMMTGAEFELVRYGGGPAALKGTIEGKSELMFEPLSASVEPLKSGKLRALAVTGATPSPALPDLPTLGQSLPGFEASAASGLGAPRATPPEIVATLNQAVNAAFADPDMRAHLAETGGTMLTGSPADFGRLMAEETAKWAKVVKFTTGKQ
jgi:tripartite-type tricarboxylate transporter receptor subunit TctC